jgi:NADH-quinone oxidoreductase subunit I
MKGIGANNNYWGNIKESVLTIIDGIGLTFRHAFSIYKKQSSRQIQQKNYFSENEGAFTIQYPSESIPVPDNGRYRLHNEIDDCIVCDKCAKICPVNCIDIEPIKAVEEIGKTSDGTTKRLYAATFDIDMGKCCFCGLCTTVCPTECLTMTKAYDFSTYDIREHNYSFAELSPGEVAEKKALLARHTQEKTDATSSQSENAIKQAKPAIKSSTGKSKPVFRPRVQPKKGGGDQKDQS